MDVFEYDGVQISKSSLNKVIWQFNINTMFGLRLSWLNLIKPLEVKANQVGWT